MWGQPGGPDFLEITDVFEAGTQEMDEGELIFTEGFELQDAMTAFEIGEPRMDTGMIVPEDNEPEFDPTIPLLPEEVCWIIDRSFACEVIAYGTTLSQSVYTLLYVHHMEDLNPDYLAYRAEGEDDPQRPVELLYVVIRAAVLGLLKSCDMTWRELNKGKVFDGEDWQAEKCEVSLAEGVQLWAAIKVLEDACRWTLAASQVPDVWRRPLHARLLLRKTILELLTTNCRSEAARFDNLVSLAHGTLTFIRSNPVPDPAPGSPAHKTFDANVLRRLHTFMPLRPIELRSQQRTWDDLQGWLDAWTELRYLSCSPSIVTWEIVGLLRAWNPNPARSTPYMRALTQSVFFSEVLVLDQFAPIWLVDRFFKENAGVPFHSVTRTVQQQWEGGGEPPLRELERAVIKLTTKYIRSLWANPPRRRRYLAKSIASWHELRTSLLLIASNLNNHVDTSIFGILPASTMATLPDLALHGQLTATREVVLSGFQLDLYGAEEKPLAYWYAGQALSLHVDCLERMIKIVERDEAISQELVIQRDFAAGLTNLCAGNFALQVVIAQHSPPWDRLRVHFERRYKWAVPLLASDSAYGQAPAIPHFDKFVTAYEQSKEKQDHRSAVAALARGRGILLHTANLNAEGRATRWVLERAEFLRRLAESTFTPSISADGELLDLHRLAWDPTLNPWFPVMSEQHLQQVAALP